MTIVINKLFFSFKYIIYREQKKDYKTKNDYIGLVWVEML